ncbi:hypothetical protein MJO29_008864 [Puccinia striiformis f. sp. tritici]|uniref:hypothetical protein n=1 Tax=Puccinia striiformis f. sp. tritici TaxID=168172 RepID=UPI0020073EC9|nr:hypothetical protein Pst134EA_014964 [Puccinia striiformis f. sp. tritici]KAH9462873.1 hypothetical protein Pst134EA_014964 [Puccinia striiformis f. sp. tritici]KAI7953233.1 hypothetical protein MJO29_008864 [Puccinia striiformis f. sp. tritici]KAI9603312.1 hypothetical protein H4Q26_002631 [Puccinia striiformis f. sp. tritici PST-130]
MADSGIDLNSPVGNSVLELLLHLQEKYQEPVRREAGEKKEELTQEDLETKQLLLAQLESSLLPSIHNQIDSYLTSLDIQDDSRKPNPDFELTFEILSRLEQTLDETRECIESAALGMIPIGTHDHHLKQLTVFRCTLLMSGISILTHCFHSLFFVSILFVLMWHDLSKDPESTTCQFTLSVSMRCARRYGTECNETIDEALKLLHGSACDIIQDEWQQKRPSLNLRIEILTPLTTIVPQRDVSALRQHVIKLANLTMPLIKITRIFYNDFSSRTRKKLRLTLYTELDSKTLTQLHESAATVTARFVVLVRALGTSYDNNSLAYDRTLIPKQVQDISQTLDSTLVILATHPIPLPGQISHSPSEKHYKARLSDLQEQWHCAVKNFLTTFLSIEG